jgi:superfamily II DNA or RNA helicase
MNTIEALIPNKWFDRATTLYVVRHHFQAGVSLIRIATGFFTVRGYNLIRKSARDKKIYILVGLDDPGKDRVRKALIEEIMRDLGTGIDIDRRVAVQELVDKMEAGNFRIIDARAKEHHAKLFIVDDTVALIASSNLSQRGMLDAIEAGYVVENPFAVRYYLAKFDAHFYAPDSLDITQELLEALRRWSGMISPWDIYLKTLLALKDLEELPEDRPMYRKPVGFQNDVIARLLRQIEEYDGAMLVASTGLGKTVVATDIARRLRKAGKIDNILVIAPEPVRDSWKLHLRPAGLTPEFYNHSALDVMDYQHNQNAHELDYILDKYLDRRWLVILDESHELRNRYQYKWDEDKLVKLERKAFERLRQAFDRSLCRILLLTATPFAKEIDNINNQLFLLPHTAEPNALLPAYIDDARAWRIHELRDLRESPPVSIITTPYVARYYGLREERGISINFNGQKKYLPHVVLYAAKAQVILESEMIAALDGYAFKRKSLRARYQPIETQARIAWGSSPSALLEVVEQSIRGKDHGGYNVQFYLTDEERKRFLNPIYEKLGELKLRDDPKLRTLIDILNQRSANGEKIILFVERRPTAIYLEEAIKTLQPHLRVANTIDKNNSGGYFLKDQRTVNRILADFAPIANCNDNTDQTYDVLITTDAYGVGVNLQDASVIVNYDLAWTSIEPDQRAGRILRFWDTPREVSLYVFFPTFEEKTYQRESGLLLARWHRLLSRHKSAQTLMDMPTITEVDHQIVDLTALAGKQSIQRLGEIDFDEVEQLESSEVFQHTAVLIQQRDYARTILDDIISAKTYNGSDFLLYLLVSARGRYYWMIYDIGSKHLRDRVKDIELLNLIQAEPKTPTAIIDPNEIEHACDACLRLWCRQSQIEPEEVYRICAMMLVPEGKGDDLRSLLE